MDRAIEDARKTLKVTVPKESQAGQDVDVLTLDFSDPSPRLAASFLHHLMHTYLAERQSWKTEDATAAEDFVTGQLGSVRHALDDIQNVGAVDNRLAFARHVRELRQRARELLQ